MKTLPTLLISWLCILSISAFADGTNQLDKQGTAADLMRQADDKLQDPSPANSQAAADLLVNASALDPNNAEILLKLGWVYQDKLHDPHAAYPYLSAAVRRTPDDVNARKLLGLACNDTGRTKQAVEEFRVASTLAPTDLWIRAQLARALARAGSYHEAAKIYAEILMTDPANADARLGQAELAAWRGHSEHALEILDQLLKENPANVGALLLKADIERWGWDLKQARQDYQQVLTLEPNHYAAVSGLESAKEMAMSDLTGTGYYFRDSTDFVTEYVQAGARLHLAGGAFAIARAAGWQFSAPGSSKLRRADGALGLEYHMSRSLETTLEGNIFDYDHRDRPFYGGKLSIKLSPTPNIDIYAVGALKQPFVSSIVTVADGMKEDSIGGGLDIKLPARFSFQNSFEYAWLSDHNAWWEEKPQLSFKLLDVPEIYIRALYDYLHYSDENTNYWTPGHWNTLSPVLDINIPLGKYIHINLDGKTPYVFDASRFGYQFGGGPTLDLASWLQIGGSYIYGSIPGDPKTSVIRPPWSGQGGQAYVRLRF